MNVSALLASLEFVKMTESIFQSTVNTKTLDSSRVAAFVCFFSFISKILTVQESHLILRRVIEESIAPILLESVFHWHSLQTRISKSKLIQLKHVILGLLEILARNRTFEYVIQHKIQKYFDESFPISPVILSSSNILVLSLIDEPTCVGVLLDPIKSKLEPSLCLSFDEHVSNPNQAFVSINLFKQLTSLCLRWPSSAQKVLHWSRIESMGTIQTYRNALVDVISSNLLQYKDMLFSSCEEKLLIESVLSVMSKGSDAAWLLLEKIISNSTHMERIFRASSLSEKVVETVFDLILYYPKSEFDPSRLFSLLNEIIVQSETLEAKANLLRYFKPFIDNASFRTPALNALEAMVINCLPISPSDAEKYAGKELYESYLSFMNELISILCSENGLYGIHILAGHVCRNFDHQFMNRIRSSLVSVANTISEPSSIIKFLFDLPSSQAWDLPTKERYTLQIFCPFLSGSTLSSIEAFFAGNILSIMSLLEGPPSNTLELIYRKTAAFHMIKICYLLPKSMVHDVTGSIVLAFGQNSPKNANILTAQVIKYSQKARCESFPEDLPKKIRLAYEHSAYLAMATVLLKTQSQPTVFTFLLLNSLVFW